MNQPIELTGPTEQAILARLRWQRDSNLLNGKSSWIVDGTQMPKLMDEGWSYSHYARTKTAVLYVVVADEK